MCGSSKCGFVVDPFGPVLVGPGNADRPTNRSGDGLLNDPELGHLSRTLESADTDFRRSRQAKGKGYPWVFNQDAAGDGFFRVEHEAAVPIFAVVLRYLPVS